MTRHWFDPYSPAVAANPYPAYARLRQREPVLRCEALGLTLFSRYEDMLALLRDPRLGRAPLGDDTPLPRRQMPHYRRYVSRNLLEREGESHSRLRGVFARLLTPARIAALRPWIEARCTQLVDTAMTRDRFDLLGDIAVPLTVHTIAELMGWPECDRDRLRPWSARIVRLYEKNATPAHEADAEGASTEFASAIAELVAVRKHAPRDDLISHLAAFEHNGELSHDELVSSCMLLLNAGHEATVNAAGNGMLALLRHPGQFERLRAGAGIAAAVEEMLRYDPPLHLFHRFVTTDFEFAGTRLRRGDKIGLLYGSANRDPAAFPQPDRFDVTRRPNRHLAFGAGTHFCMGAPLARLELQVLFSTLSARRRAVALADTQPRYRGGFVFRGLQGLTLTPAG